MSLSITTPHYNDLEGIKRLYNCLQVQTVSNWEWIVVDDFSESTILQGLKIWFQELKDDRVQLVCNAAKMNASICRNKGADIASYDNLVFLDADDYISQNFVLNRDIDFNEFVVFKNSAVIDRDGTQEIRPRLNEDYLDCFLKAKFIWPITATLWKKKFFKEIGGFDPVLQRLQDVELSIRALFVGEKYKIDDNEIDFFYCTKPIRSKVDIVRKSCTSVNYLVSKIKKDYTLTAYRHSLIKSYYYACVKGLHRCKNRKDAVYVKESLTLFYKEKYIGILEYVVGMSLLMLYRYHMISDSLFIRSNRSIFKVT